MKAKFRIYDLQEKKMVFEGFHVFGEVTLFDAIGQYVFETKGSKSTLERYNDLVEMRYSGLPDLNGIDICEGDIVLVPEDYETGEGCDTRYIRWEVVFANGTFQLTNKKNPVELENSTLYEDHFSYDGKFEILGDKYTHPELIG